jgi:hypothetical protein
VLTGMLWLSTRYPCAVERCEFQAWKSTSERVKEARVRAELGRTSISRPTKKPSDLNDYTLLMLWAEAGLITCSGMPGSWECDLRHEGGRRVDWAAMLLGQMNLTANQIQVYTLGDYAAGEVSCLGMEKINKMEKKKVDMRCLMTNDECLLGIIALRLLVTASFVKQRAEFNTQIKPKDMG